MDVTVTKEGYIKRSSLRSYNASKGEDMGIKEGDYLLFSKQMNTLDHLLLVTNKANMLYRPVYDIPDLRWKDTGEHISQTINGLEIDEYIIGVFVYREIKETQQFVFMSQEGMIKQTKLSAFEPWRTYKSRGLTCMKLKSNEDQLVNVYLIDETDTCDVVLATYRGFGLRYNLSEEPKIGAKAAGVKAINLKEDDHVINGCLIQTDQEQLTLMTQRGSAKRMKVAELPVIGRAKRGLMLLKELKGSPHRLVYMGNIDINQQLIVTTGTGDVLKIENKMINMGDRTSNGSFVTTDKQITLVNVHPMIEAALKDNDIS